ncbi:hypothetical protein HPP92_000827 [Vanilla planifolia]|uniref:Uncharacterized protein n=1 Tax=Vanilla planifolia TaxID=51239 RepID=A0A835VH01_VANPL|nr:hypothetical protein HPP92_000827 [Vanilla planifolia]
MDFSNDWRSLWSITSVFPAPKRISIDFPSPFGPLNFRPCPARHTLLASPSLVLRVPPISRLTIVEGIRAFFCSPSNGSFLPSADQDDLAADILSSLASTDEDLSDPLSRNNLYALPCRNGSYLLLFFPTGDNADEIGFLCLHFEGENLTPDVLVDIDGEIYKQREGMKHRRHRILKMSVVPAPPDHSSPTGNSITEGFLIATTSYSVNWFRVETRVSDKGKQRHSLVPMAKQGFLSCVVDACWSPHFLEESAVLLETGELCWFNIISKRGGTVKVSLSGGLDPGRWLGCHFGGQPWVLLVACSSAVVMIDLRPSRINEEPKVFARIQLPDSLGTISQGVKDSFVGFCRASFSDCHFSVVTKKFLLLFDIRQPLVPILTWNHGLQYPMYVSMFRLSELRPSERFGWASESGFVILVGSFRKNEFKVFCYGPTDKGAFGTSSFHAWDLPSSLSLSGRQFHSGDDLLNEMMLKEKLPNPVELELRKEGVAGFSILPSILFKTKLDPGGFVLIRLTLSGKLEIQEYSLSSDSSNMEPICQGTNFLAAKDLNVYCVSEETSLHNGYNFFKLSYLYNYMHGNLVQALCKGYLDLNHKGTEHRSFNDELKELISSRLQSSSFDVYAFTADVSIPTNVFEVASRRILSTLLPDILPLAFSKYGELFTSHARTSFLPLEFPQCLPFHRLPPFFMNRPSRRSELLSSKVLPRDAIVGPLLPMSVLLALQQMYLTGRKDPSSTEPNDDLLSLECKAVIENVFPEISIAESCGFSGWESSQELQNDKPFFVYKPTHGSFRSSFKKTNSSEEELPKTDHVPNGYLVSQDNVEDERFTTFICGFPSNTSNLSHGSEDTNCEKFDFSPVRLEFESPDIELQPTEQKILNSLAVQAAKWLDNNKSYKEFSTKIPKPTSGP